MKKVSGLALLAVCMHTGIFDKMFWKAKVFFLTAWYLMCARGVLRAPDHMALGDLGNRKLPVPHAVLARKASKFVRFLVRRRKNYCVLHSIALCRLLRRYGLDLELNVFVAIRKDESGNRVQGHCWPTLDGERYFDSAHDTDMDGLDLLTRSSRGVNYWTQKLVGQF